MADCPLQRITLPLFERRGWQLWTIAIITAHDCFNTCADIEVLISSELAENIGPDCTGLIGDKCSLPHHSLLSLKFSANASYSFDKPTPPLEVAQCKRPRNFPPTFLSSDLCCLALKRLIDDLLSCQKSQDNIDRLYIDGSVICYIG